MKGLICFHIERNPYGDHMVKRKTEKEVCFISRVLEHLSSLTNLNLCEAGIYNLDML